MNWVFYLKTAVNLDRVIEINFHKTHIRFYFAKTEFSDFDGEAKIIAEKTEEIKKKLKLNY